MMATNTVTEIDYPSSDGQPMAETPLHVETMMLLHQALEDFFQARPDVFIATDIFWYWKEGDVKSCVAPDALVAIGVPERDRYDRCSYFSWLENDVVPSVVFEVASRGNWRDDLNIKYKLYEKLGVPEYFIYDPEGEYLRPALQGFRLESGVYRRIIPLDVEAGEQDELVSSLGFRLRGEGVMLRLIDTASGRPILSRAEQVEATESLADRERERADRLASEVERLKAKLAQLGQTTENGS